MNILEIHGRNTAFGGASVFTGDLSKSLSQHGNKVLIICNKVMYI